MKLGMLILLSGIVVLLLASSLLADDGSKRVDEASLPDTTSTMPVALSGVSSGFSLEQEPELRLAPKKSVFLSAILPGLGQANNGRWAKASAFVVIGSLLVTKIIVESDRADRYLQLYTNATSEDEAEDLYQHYSYHYDRRDQYIWWAVGFWVYNLLDAYIDGHLFAFSRQ